MAQAHSSIELGDKVLAPPDTPRSTLDLLEEESLPSDQEAVPPEPPSEAPPTLSLTARLQRFVVDNFLVLGFIVATIVALAWPQSGKTVAKLEWLSVRIVQAINNILVFLISGLTLKSKEFKDLLKHWVGVLYGFAAILVITPCLGFGLRELPLQPHAFTVGATIFCAVPTTLGVGVALVGACHANQALALLLTVGTNMLGVLLVPWSLKLLLAGMRASFNIPELLLKLCITVLVPSIVGKVLRDTVAPVRNFVDRHRTAFSLFSTSNLVVIVWQSLSSARDQLLHQSWSNFLAVTATVSLSHVAYLVFNTAVVGLLRLPLKEAIAVAIMASQKSAPVAVAVISYLTKDISLQGLYTVPCVIGQLFQIFLGSILVKFLARKVQKAEKDKE